MEAIIAVIGAVIGLFIYRAFGQKNVERGQEKLENRVKEIRKEDDKLHEEERATKSREADKVKEIENEQNRDVTVDELVDFFNNRKGK